MAGPPDGAAPVDGGVAVPSPLPRGLRRLEIVVLLLAVLATGILFTWFAASAPREAPSWLLPLDDAYIFLRYAQQAARGLPLEWTAGEPSTGASSFLYPWLEAPAFWFSDGPEAPSRWAFWLGALGLWALAAGGARWLRVAGAPDPWPLGGGLVLAWAGPLVFGSLGGMESAWNAAAIVWAAAFWSEGPSRGPGKAHGPALVLVAFLPWFRPENGLLTLLAAIALLAGRGPGPRLASLPILLPGAALAAIDLSLTGHLSPAGALAKSRLGAPFVDGSLLATLYGHGFAERIAPIYLGGEPAVLPPPIGWLAILGASLCLVTALRRRLGSLRLAWPAMGASALAWLALVLLAPLSSLVHWHYWRHHHAGLALAWLLALAVAAEGLERLRRGRTVRWRTLALLPALVLFLLLPAWGLRYAGGMDVLWARNGRGAEFLQGLQGNAVLLLNDAGLLSLAWDGPMIDAVGLGSNGLALPFRHGPGSLVESLARRETLPEIAAVHPEMFRVPELLGEPLRPADSPRGLLIARVRQELLRSTILAGPGIDFGLLAGEETLDWQPPPHPNHASFALLRPGLESPELLGGCRPLPGALRIPVDPGEPPAILRVTALDDRPTPLALRYLEASGSPTFQRETRIGPDRWTDVDLPLPFPGGTVLELVRTGDGVPCLESLRMAG